MFFHFSTSYLRIYISFKLLAGDIFIFFNMATLTGKSVCVACKKEKVVYTCIGCSQTFCKNHLAEHNHELGKQLDKIEYQRNIFWQRLTEQKPSFEQQSLAH